MSDFTRPTLSALVTQTQSDINGRVPGADSRLRRSVLGVLAKVWAGLVHGLYGYAARLAQELLPDTATLWLARHGAIWGISRKAATYAAGPATLEGTVGATVPAGTIIERGDGVRYAVSADVHFTGATATAGLLAQTPGAVGNAIAGTSLSLVSPVLNVNSEATVAAPGIAGGNDIEDPENWRARILARIQRPPQGGSRADYELWAKATAGVTRVWVYPRWMGAGTVGVAFVYDGRDDIFPTSDERTAMRTWLGGLCPVHLADFGIYIVALTEAADDLPITLIPDTPAVRAAVVASVADFYRRVAEPGATILRSQINEAISLSDGETDHVLDLADNITHTATQMPVPGAFTRGP